MDGFLLQTDDGFVVLCVGRKGHAYGTDRMIDDPVDEEGVIRHEFAHPSRVPSLSDGPLQYISFSDVLHKRIEIGTLEDQNAFVQVSSTTVTRRMILPVPFRLVVSQKETVTQIDFKCSGLFTEHRNQRLQ